MNRLKLKSRNIFGWVCIAFAVAHLAKLFFDFDWRTYFPVWAVLILLLIGFCSFGKILWQDWHSQKNAEPEFEFAPDDPRRWQFGLKSFLVATAIIAVFLVQARFVGVIVMLYVPPLIAYVVSRRMTDAQSRRYVFIVMWLVLAASLILWINLTILFPHWRWLNIPPEF